jgi:uncharacterized protein with GYD domain
MKYVLLGHLSEGWAAQHDKRVKAARDKLKKLGIKLQAVHYTQGQYDFVDVVDTPNPEALLAFSVWYAQNGFGRIQSLPAFDNAAMQKALKAK